MQKSRSKIIIEDYKSNFNYKKNETNLNIKFNRVAFIFFTFFIIYLIYTIHLIHLGSRKSKTEIVGNISVDNNKLYMCDNYHLSPKSLPILFKNYLFKP